MVGVFVFEERRTHAHVSHLTWDFQKLFMVGEKSPPSDHSVFSDVPCFLLLQKFPLESDGSVLAETLKQFSVYLDEVSKTLRWLQIFV